ncbi:Rho-specific inhibitor of transcription termination (YaeO) [Klebsiella pneumoniae]|uniref:Rho-specific inhibitor of transcription termination (YaeO) n=1 Tax=Klebsiella pneumoniae TaxID=573 RepID=A0A2X3DDW2_KLEPN|nr:Rho-specific inhibitor of transcription termination (YaeO) [Klebsiella pneumoniae]
MILINPLTADDYDNLELACQHHLVLTLALKDGEQLQAKASDLISRKNIEYLVVELAGNVRELRLDKNRQLQSPGNRHRGGERILNQKRA